MAYFLSPLGNSQFFDANGDPLVGGKIHTYLAGSTTAAATYTDDTGLTQQANPIILNSLGVAANRIWLASGVTYKFVVTDADDVTLSGLGGDDISGINDATTVSSEWVDSGFVPTYLSATTFSVPGDQTDTLLVGRRLQTRNTSGLIYSRITVSSFGASITTVTVVNDSGMLDAGLSTVSYGLLSSTNKSIPYVTGQLLGVQTFTVTGTYTPTVGTQSVIVEVQAPGGGSGGCVATTAGQWAAGRPGAGGGYGRKRITAAFSGVTVTIGAAGTAGAAGDNSGGTGGTTSFGALISCTGGAGGGGSGVVQTAIGVTSGSLPAGGTATSADLSRPGGSPTISPFALAATTVISPSGGASFFGPGGLAQSVVTNNINGQTPGGYGGGASGPANANAILAANTGVVGAPGIVIVHEYA